jgi:YD repeat-containing protein
VLAKYELHGTSSTWRDFDGPFLEIQNFQVYGDAMKLSPADKKAVLELFKNDYIQSLQKAGIKTSEAPYNFNGFNGVELRSIGPGGAMVARLFFAYSRLYSVSVLKHGADRFDSQLELLQKFRILEKNEYVNKLIEENMPKPLPQEPAATRPSNDAQQDGLKGKVKEAIKDEQSGTGTRERSDESYYDMNGNRVKEIDFINGYPTGVTLWGWIDGMRVTNDNFIEYGINEGPNEKDVIMALGATDAEDTTTSPKTRDERFSQRYDYKYDSSGKLIEELISQNTGDVWTRTVYKYTSGQVETIIYDEKGKLSTRSVDSLDQLGNIVEHKSYDNKGKIDGTEIYKYEFDSLQNWVAMRTFEKKTVKGKSILKLTRTEFRTIKYY